MLCLLEIFMVVYVYLFLIQVLVGPVHNFPLEVPKVPLLNHVGTAMTLKDFRDVLMDQRGIQIKVESYAVTMVSLLSLSNSYGY